MDERFQGSFADPEHDHAHCVIGAMASAETICRVRGARLTGQRRRVLEIIWKSHVPIGAYDILAALSPDERAVAPPTVYRALEFLQAHGLVHKIESLKAYVGCQHPGHDHVGQFLICQDCGNAAEIDDPAIERAIQGRADAAGFHIAETTLEVRGLCPSCAPAPAPQ
jgi:Fur family zinc uptake transcriptional regulator